MSVVSATMRGMATLPLTDLPRRLFVCSPSRLTTWLDCPRKYRFTYVERPAPPKGPPWAHNSLGAAVHAALAGWWRLPRRERTSAAAGRLLDEAWSRDGFRDADQATSWQVRAREMVHDYLATQDRYSDPVGVERTVAFTTATLSVSGRIDRLDQRGDELVVVDYKTGRRGLSSDDARGSLALALYARAVERVLRRRCRRVELHHLPSGTVVAWEHSDDGIARQVARAEDIAVEARDADDARQSARGDQGIADELYPARPGPGCGWCDYVRVCPAGAATGPPALPWAGLAEDVGPTLDPDAPPEPDD